MRFFKNKKNIFPKFSVEWELQLLNGINRSLTNKIMLVMDNLPHQIWFGAESFQSSIEVHSSECETLLEMEESLKLVRIPTI